MIFWLLFHGLLALAAVGTPRRRDIATGFATGLVSTLFQAVPSVAMTQDEENVEPKPKDGYLESALDYYKGVVSNQPKPLGENQDDRRVRQCVGEGIKDCCECPVCRCPRSADEVCEIYKSSDETTATTPAFGLQSIVAVPDVSRRTFRGVYFRVVEKENPNRRGAGGQNKAKYKVKDSNGKDELIFPGLLRDTSAEEKAAFKAAEKKAEAAKAARQKLPKRLGGAPPIMPGVIVEAEPSDDEIKVVMDPMHKAMCASGYNPLGSGGKRDANGKLLDMPAHSLILVVDAAKCEIARRESKECERSYKQADVRSLSKRKQLGIFCEQRTWWLGLDKKYHKADALVSERERHRRRLRTAAASRDETRKRHDESPQDPMTDYVYWDGENRLRGRPSRWRPSPGEFLPPYANSHQKFLAETFEDAIGGKDELLEKMLPVIELGFSFEALSDLTKCGWFGSDLVEGSFDHARTCRIGTCGFDCWRDVIEVYSLAATDHWDEKVGEFNWEVCDSTDEEDAEDAAWCRIGKRMLKFQEVGLAEFDKKKATWVSWGAAWEKVYAAFATRAEQMKDVGVSGFAIDTLTKPEGRPSLATLMVAYFSLYVHHQGELPFSVYCKYGVQAISRAMGGEDFARAVLAERKLFIDARNAWLERYKAGEEGLPDILVQGRGPQAPLDKFEERLYTRVFQVKIPAWAFEGKTGASRILAEDPETKELLAFIEAAAGAVVTGKDRVDVGNVRDFLSLDDGLSCVLYGCDTRWSFDGGMTWLHTRAKWYDDDLVSFAELAAAHWAAHRSMALQDEL